MTDANQCPCCHDTDAPEVDVLDELRQEWISEDDIEALQVEAGEAGDSEMVETCHKALAGDERALRQCTDVIAEARAMGNDS